MGGMKAWKESMRSQNDMHQMWEKEEMENWFGSAEAEGGDVDEGAVERRKEEVLEEVLEEMGVEKEREDEKKQEEEAKSEEEV